MSDSWRVEGNEVRGEIALLIRPGTSSQQLEQQVAEALAEPLARIAKQLSAPLAAGAYRYARQKPGRDADGRTCFVIAARVEADRLVPAHKPLRR